MLIRNFAKLNKFYEKIAVVGKLEINLKSKDTKVF